MELPFSLRTLPPEAIDILRFFGSNGAASAHADEITQGAGLTDRGFGKAIRRLVTKGMIVMDGDQIYRLSDAGRRSVAELLEYDLNTPEAERPVHAAVEAEPRFVRRHVIVALPAALTASQNVPVVVGIDAADDDELVMLPLHVQVGVSMVHGEPATPEWAELAVENRPVQHALTVKAGSFSMARLRVQVCQSDVQGEIDESACGGLYVDVPVEAHTGEIRAFGTDVLLKDTSSDAFDIT